MLRQPVAHSAFPETSAKAQGIIDGPSQPALHDLFIRNVVETSCVHILPTQRVIVLKPFHLQGERKVPIILFAPVDVNFSPKVGLGVH